MHLYKGCMFFGFVVLHGDAPYSFIVSNASEAWIFFSGVCDGELNLLAFNSLVKKHLSSDCVILFLPSNG